MIQVSICRLPWNYTASRRECSWATNKTYLFPSELLGRRECSWATNKTYLFPSELLRAVHGVTEGKFIPGSSIILRQLLFQEWDIFATGETTAKALLEILQRKHEKERAFLSKLLQDRGRQDLWDAATVMSSVQKQERLLELTSALRTAERGKAGTGEYRKVLQEAAIVKFQSRKSSLEKEKGVGVSNDDVVVSVLKDLYHEQDKDQKNVIEQSSVMGEPTLAGVQKQCLELLKQGRSENVSIVVLAAEVTKEAGQEELIDALEGKYDALRDKLIAEALAKQMGEAEWSLLSEQERQARLIKMKLEQRKLRQEGRQEEADAILAQLLKDQQNLESLMGDTRAEQERKLKERLARRKKRLEEGMTEEEAERLEQEEIQEEEEEKRKQLSVNILADLEKRYEEEKEALLASLKSADAQVDSERKRQAELTRLRLEQRRARQEDNFEAAAIVMGLAQSSEAAKEKERARQEQLARERLEERRRKRRDGHGKVEPTEEAVSVPEDEEDALAWQEAVVREMEKKHTEERDKLVELLQTEGASGSSGRQKAQAVTEQDRQDRLFELSEIRRDWREQSSAELSETQDEQEEIFEESTALRVECCLVALQSAAEGKSLSDDDVHVSLLADLQQHQDKESHYLLQDLATKTVATLKQVKTVQYRARADRWYDNVAAVLLTGGRPKSPEEGGSEGELVKALEDKYDALRDKLIMQALIDTMGEAEWAALSEKERQARLALIDTMGEAEWAALSEKERQARLALIDTMGEAEWAALSEKERQARLVKMKLQERRLRQQGKFDEAAALLGEGIKNQEELARLLGEARTDQKKQLEEKLARRRQLKAEREAQGLATDDATLDEIQEEEEKKNLPKNILAELQSNFEVEKEALLASLRNQDERFASERNRQLELARLRREQKRLNQEDKFDSAAIVFSIARRNEAAKVANVEKDRERQKQLAQERLAARKKKKQEQADLTNREALEERLRQEEEDQRLEEEEERSKMTDEGAVGLQVAVLSELEKKHSAERDVLMQLVQAAEGNQAGRAEVNKMADEELTSNLESLRQQRQAWRQKVAEGEEVTDVSERAKVQSEQNHFLGQAVLITMEGKCRELTPQLEGKTPEEVTAEASVLLLAELQQKQEAEGNALNSVLSGSLEEDLLKSLKDDQRRARREGWLDNLAAVVLGLTKDAQDRPGTTDSTGSREEKAISGQEEKQLQDLDDELEQQKQELIKKGQLGEDIDVEEAMAELEKQYKAKREALSSDMARQRAQLKERLAARKAKRENQMYEEDMAAAMIQRASQQAAQLSQMAEADKAKHGDKLQERLAARREARRLAAEAKKKEEEDQKRKKSEKGALPPGFSMKREKTVINVDLSKEKQDEILESLRSDKDKADKKLQRDKERISLQVQAKLEQRKRTRVSAAQEVFTLGERQKTILEKTQHEDRERQMTIVKERIQKVKYERTMTIKARQRASQAKFEEMLTTQDVQQLSRDEKMNRAAEEMMRKFRTDEEDVKKGMKSAFALDDSADSDSMNSGAEEGVSAGEQVRPKTRGRMTDEEKRKLMKERFEKRKERKRTQEGTQEHHGYRDRFNAEPERHAREEVPLRSRDPEYQRRSLQQLNAMSTPHPSSLDLFLPLVLEDIHSGRDYCRYLELYGINLSIRDRIALGLPIPAPVGRTRRDHAYRGGVNVVPESRSNLVESSVVPDRFEDLSLTEQLKMYHSKKLKLEDEQTKHAKELVKIYIGGIVDNVKEQIDAGRPQKANRCRIEFTGSMYEGTKFGQPDEFDIMVVIDGSEDIESEEMTPGYARLRVGQQPFVSHRFSKCLDQYQNINPTKMLDWFYGLVQKGVNKVSTSAWDPVSLTVSRHGPAVMVNIEESNGLSIDVDLVLCVQLSQERYYVAKPYKPYADESLHWSLACDPAVLWRQSFSVTETRMIARIDGANECRRDCLRVLKSIFRREPGMDKFTSFHLKTVLLRMCQDEEQWPSSKMGERFLDLLRRIELCLRDEHLPHFYLPELNLLDGIRHETIENMSRRVRRLINSESERNRILYVR
ncbi:MAB21L2 [Branchiostoma lanceolatum]|uniref:MAB21L2 protein n=1 Tax=Branchiostoma lanceolatum TaxID=7740 RepID=A0A8K0ET65_BRALA|nr:MAB21L2 [Branchiostoma lanceolatum]